MEGGRVTESKPLEADHRVVRLGEIAELLRENGKLIADYQDLLAINRAFAYLPIGGREAPGAWERIAESTGRDAFRLTGCDTFRP